MNAASALLTAAVTLLSPVDLSRPGVGDAAPVLDVETLDGHPLPHARLDGGITVVDFFATWCKPCHQALRDLGAVRATLGTGVRVVIVAVGEDPRAVRRFLADNPPPDGVEVALDRGGGTSRRWGQTGFPTTFLVDDRGIIQHINRGWGAGYQARVLKWLRAMLASGDGAPRPARPPEREIVKGVEILR